MNVLRNALFGAKMWLENDAMHTPDCEEHDEPVDDGATCYCQLNDTRALVRAAVRAPSDADECARLRGLIRWVVETHAADLADGTTLLEALRTVASGGPVWTAAGAAESARSADVEEG